MIDNEDARMITEAVARGMALHARRRLRNGILGILLLAGFVLFMQWRAVV